MWVRWCRVCASCLISVVLAVQAREPDPAAGSLRVREAELARQAAEQRAAELDAALGRAQQQIERLRAENAELRVSLHECRASLALLRQRAAHMLLDRSPAELDRTLQEAVDSLRRMRAARLELAGEVQDFREVLAAALDRLQASVALRKDLLSRCDALVRKARQVEQWPSSQVAGRGGHGAHPLESRVLTVNDDLQVVVLDSGSAQGVRIGATARVLDKGREIGRLRVVEVRPRLSAAIPVKGRLRDFAPGMPVRFGEVPARTK